MVGYKKALQTLWKGVCNVYIQDEVNDPMTKRTKFNEILTVSKEPCKLSFESVKVNVESDHAAEIVQAAKLILSNEIQISPGSKIEVTQNGRTSTFEQSGQPAVYTHHQEIPLKLFKGWS